MRTDIGMWEEALRNSGYTVYRDGVVPPSEPVDLAEYPAVVGDFGGDSNDGNVEDDEDEAENKTGDQVGDEVGDEAEDEADDYADANDMGYVRPAGDRYDIGENIALVTAAFRAAGNPRYQDVRLKQVRTAWALDPTLREIARKRTAPSLSLPSE
jgi:hypothetical protein